MSNRDQSYLKGQFLIAMPALIDPNFRQTVTCLSEHTSEGAVGIVINKVHPILSAGVIFQELGMTCLPEKKTIAVHIGGPVHPNELFVLHGPPISGKDTLRITNNLAMSNSREILEAIAIGQGPGDYLIALGCAGWGPGQLEWEIQQNAWLTSDSNYDTIFKTPIEDRWQTAIRLLGIDPDLLSDAAGHA